MPRKPASTARATPSAAAFNPTPRLEVEEWFYGLATQWAKLLRTSPTPAAATKALIAHHAADLREDPERAIFWLMVAYYQCRDGCLQPVVRQRALAAIRRGSEKIMWLDTSSSTPARRRKEYERIAQFIAAADDTGD